MKAILVMVSCAAIVGCGLQPPQTGDELSQKLAAQDAEISMLALRVGALESASAEQASIVAASIAAAQADAPEVGAPWVAWFKETPINSPFLTGYKPDTPAGAFSTRNQCIDAIREAIASNGGDPDKGSYIVDKGQYTQVNSYACLPNGTDPRIRR